MDSPPPYYAVIFVNQRSGSPDADYRYMADEMDVLVQEQPGYLGHDSTRGEDGLGITVSYWSDEDAIDNWKQVAAHLHAQKQGQDVFYDWYRVHVAKVERAYTGG